MYLTMITTATCTNCSRLFQFHFHSVPLYPCISLGINPSSPPPGEKKGVEFSAVDPWRWFLSHQFPHSPLHVSSPHLASAFTHPSEGLRLKPPSWCQRPSPMSMMVFTGLQEHMYSCINSTRWPWNCQIKSSASAVLFTKKPRANVVNGKGSRSSHEPTTLQRALIAAMNPSVLCPWYFPTHLSHLLY